MKTRETWSGISFALIVVLTVFQLKNGEYLKEESRPNFDEDNFRFKKFLGDKSENRSSGAFNSLKDNPSINSTEIFANAKNLCNPDGKGSKTKCSMKCIDKDYDDRIGMFYPPINEDFDELKDCPSFWQTNKITINDVNLDEESISNIQFTGYFAMALNFAVLVFGLFIILRSEGFLDAFNRPPIPDKLIRDLLPRKVTRDETFRRTLLTGGLILQFLMALIDSFFDAYYFSRLESSPILVHFDFSVIKAMAAFCILAVFKDAIVGIFIYIQFYGKESYYKAEGATVVFKFLESGVSFFFEDFAQVALQYFYFEKFQMIGSRFMYFNAIFMVIKAFDFGFRVLMLLKKWWNYENLRYDIAFIFFVAIFANLYPISRFGGIKYQISQGDAVIQGSCLRYDAEKQILIGTPFINGFNCWNAADFLVIIAPFGLLIFFMCSLSMGCKTFQTIWERVEPVTFTFNYGTNETNTIQAISGWIFDGMAINNLGSKAHEERIAEEFDRDRLLEGSEANEKLMTLEANEKLISIEGTYCIFEQRTVVGRLTMKTSNGRTFGNVLYLNIFIFIWLNL